MNSTSTPSWLTPSNGSGRALSLLKRAAIHPKRAAALAWISLLPVGRRCLASDTALPLTWGYGVLPRRTFQEIFPGLGIDDIRILRPMDRDANTSVTLVETLYLCALGRALRPRRVLEIGTFDGNTTLNLAANTDDDTAIVTLDIGPSAHIGAHYKRSAYAGRIREVIADSTTCDWSVLGAAFDLIFIDGCHTYDAATTDTNNALQHVRPGGVIVWHDYGSIKGVCQAVDAFSGQLDISVIQGTTLAVAVAPQR